MTVTLTEAHLDKLNDEDLRTLARRILNDAVKGLNTSSEAHALADHLDLDPAPVHKAANWLRKLLTNPINGYYDDTWWRHSDAVIDFSDTAYVIGDSITGDGDEFPPYLNAVAIDTILYSVAYDYGTPCRPSARHLHSALTNYGGGFIPGHDTTAGYVLKVLCDSDDLRLPALAESSLQSGLQVNLRPAIDEAATQLARLDELNR